MGDIPILQPLSSPSLIVSCQVSPLRHLYDVVFRGELSFKMTMFSISSLLWLDLG